MVPDGTWLQVAIHTPTGPNYRSCHLSSIGKVGKRQHQRGMPKR